MINFSFTISPFVNSELGHIDKTRSKVLTHLLPPITLIARQYDAKLNRIRDTLSLLGTPISKKQLENALLIQSGKRSPVEKIAAGINLVEHRMYFDHFMSDKPLTVDILEEIQAVFSGKGFVNQRRDMELTLSFIQSNPEHPVVQAALARLLVYHTLGEQELAIRMSILTSWIFLLKSGYDFHQLIRPESGFSDRKSQSEAVMKSAINGKNISSFLQMYAHSFNTAADSVLETLRSSNDTATVHTNLKLTKRQIDILRLLEKPGSKVSNRQVQKEFNVSQITASRDLAGLSQLNLILPVGRGRSAEYVKSR